MEKIIQRSFLNALGTGTYIAVVATVMSNGERLFGHINQTIGPMAFLMLFVLSAAITGSLVLGKPVLMYIDGQKREAVKLFIYTICWLAAGVVILLTAALNF